MGASAKQTGPSQAEPVVSALRASVPCAWQPFSGQYTTGERLYAGSVRVAEAAYDGARSRGDPHKYASEVFLPGLKVTRFKGEEMEEVKTYAERAVQLWFRAVLAPTDTRSAKT